MPVYGVIIYFKKYYFVLTMFTVIASKESERQFKGSWFNIGGMNTPLLTLESTDASGCIGMQQIELDRRNPEHPLDQKLLLEPTA